MTDARSLAWNEPRSTRATTAKAAAPAARLPLVYDMSHLIARLRAQTGTGIDRVDLAFATHFFGEGTNCEAVRYGRGVPCRVSGEMAAQFTRSAQGVWVEADRARAERLWAWLAAAPGGAAKPGFIPPSRFSGKAWARRLLSWTGRFAGFFWRAIPANAVYINVGYHRFENPQFFKWLEHRPDVAAVFMIHDLLPLDYPEYFRSGETEKFGVRINTALRYGRAFLVSTEAVRRRLLREFAARGLEPRPIWVRPFPSPLADHPAPRPRRQQERPYFVVVGTIEPRKNHLLLLNVWRALARRMETPPRLVIVGTRGWENEQVMDLLDRCSDISPHVAEVNDLGSRDLADLIGGARALLAPSFEEGYGLPIVEALTLGTCVVASDCDSAREASQGRACLLSPIDGEGWMAEIERLATDPGYAAAQSARASGFVAPNWRDYFASLDQFIADLRL